jgi:hypothetical protein
MAALLGYWPVLASWWMQLWMERSPSNSGAVVDAS